MYIACILHACTVAIFAGSGTLQILHSKLILHSTYPLAGQCGPDFYLTCIIIMYPLKKPLTCRFNFVP